VNGAIEYGIIFVRSYRNKVIHSKNTVIPEISLSQIFDLTDKLSYLGSMAGSLVRKGMDPESNIHDQKPFGFLGPCNVRDDEMGLNRNVTYNGGTFQAGKGVFACSAFV